ncbi:MAG TPA: DUF2339 domain-containing protein [Candidatus Limnocylindria bacterium]|nr:DUF2339 domain-containing protein [Candidatus Limnocylindria bacterium]
MEPGTSQASGLEQFIGGKLIAWIGGIALFFAAAFGLKYSVDHNLIPPAVRAAAGYLLGIGLIAGGVVLKKKDYATTSQTLCATGVVILYAVIYACRSLYHFPIFTPAFSFGLMVVNTAAAFLLAVKLDGPVVAILGMVGGFLTPILLSTGEDRPEVLFPYIAALDVGLLAVTRRKRWDYLAVLGAVGTILMQLGWQVQFYSPPKMLIAQAAFVGYSLLFAGALAWAVKRDWYSRPLVVAAVLLPVGGFVISLSLLGGGGVGNSPGTYFWAVLAIDLVLLGLSQLRKTLRPLEYAASGLSFLIIAVWTVAVLKAPLLWWGLGLYLAFGVLHTGFAVFSIRRQGLATAGLSSLPNFVPVMALLLTLLPVVLQIPVPWTFWVVVLVLDLFAVMAATMARAWAGLLFTFLMTLATAAVWMLSVPAELGELTESLFVIGGAALFFMVASLVLARSAKRDEALLSTSAWEQNVTQQIPAMATCLPLALLVMAVGRYHPADPSNIFVTALALAAVGLGLTYWQAKRSNPDEATENIANGLPLFLVAGVAVVELAAYLATPAPRLTGVFLGWNIGFAVLFMGFPFVFRSRFIDRSKVWISAAVAAPLHFGLIYYLVWKEYSMIHKGLIPAAFAVAALASVWALASWLPKGTENRRSLLSWFGAVASLFVTLIFPIEFEHEWLTLGWALEGLALCWLFLRLQHPGLKRLGVVLLAAAFQRLALNWHVFSYHPATGMRILNWYLYTYGIVAFCLLAAGGLLKSQNDRRMGLPVRPALLTGGTILLFLLLNLEIGDYFSHGGPLVWDLSGDFARGMTYTIAWSLFALGLVGIGIAARARALRYSGLGLLGVALVKLFFFDLSHLGPLYRIGAFAGVAVVAITASVLYQRFLAVARSEENKGDQP